MTIRNVAAFMAALWDWAILDGCFPGKIRPTDIDGFVERHGSFLVLEAKAPNKDVHQGQMLTFKKLQATGLFTVIIINGKPGIPESLHVLLPSGKEWHKEHATLEDLRNVVKRWVRFANAYQIASNAAEAVRRVQR